MVIYHGEKLKQFLSDRLPDSFRERYAMKNLHGYIQSEQPGRVCCLYGLRRTGKTIMMLQEIRNLGDYDRCLFLQCTEDGRGACSDTLWDIEKAIESHSGCKYIFIDEVTRAEDFIRTSSVLADIHASGKKIVLSGTDSLGMLFARYNELYDRTYFIHTTYIPFREYRYLLGKSIMDYIRYGGTLTPEHAFYNQDTLNEYSNSAIAYNITNSLRKCDRYHNAGCRILETLMENGELPSFINKVVEYPTREFLARILNSSFRSHDLGSLAQLVRTSLHLDASLINTEEMDERIRVFLGIKKNPLHTLDEEAVGVIISYLKKLEVLYQIPKECFLTPHRGEEYIFTQPGMRYCQASAMSYALFTSEEFLGYTASQRAEILKKLDSSICGGILEDIVFLELSKRLCAGRPLESQYMVTKYTNEYGQEADIVLLDFGAKAAAAIEVKLSGQQDKEQLRHLLDEGFCEEIEKKTGFPLVGKMVVYCGRTGELLGIPYVNAEDFLQSSENIAMQLMRHKEGKGLHPEPIPGLGR